jgi:hypothetical protein
MLHAKPGTVELDLIHREVVAEHQVIAACGQPLMLLCQGLCLIGAADILSDIESRFLCFTVPIDPSR